MTTPNLPDWLTVGAEVLGDREAGFLTVTRITKTTITLSDGSKWRPRTMQSMDAPPPNRQYGFGWPRLISRAEAEAAALWADKRRFANAAEKWASRGATEEDAEDLRNALTSIAPHLGLIVTDAPTED